jgi:dTMP kinase
LGLSTGRAVSTLFIAVEGPHRVGKTTVAGLLADRLAERSTAGVHLTCEPTRTPLGQMLRRSEEVLHGRALALALAADRACHVEAEIIPRLDDGLHVITDRYVQTSLVMQRIDGMDLSEIWSYNRYVLPATTFYLENAADVIRGRLTQGPALSRLAATGSPEKELKLYREAATYLRRHDWQQYTVDCHGREPDEVVSVILRQLPYRR